MLEFKLNYYFEKYKDTCIIKSRLFKELFIKENGDFPLLNELVVMIQRYQYNKYGELVESGRKTFRNVKKGNILETSECEREKKIWNKRRKNKEKIGGNEKMKEIYDLIIEKLERDKLKFSSEIMDTLDDIDYNDMSKAKYHNVKGKKDYCMDLIEFFKEVRDNL